MSTPTSTSSTALWLTAGVVVTLAYFLLVGHLAKAVRPTRRVPVTISALTGLVGALPAILLALSHTGHVPV
ncbi:hypothetical protein [Streptantibioticus cattleyicolor]|uniref:Uncharacterized protein n=1 Tax=Streptantibioticus cattleyicolor (strain ATCC 35852 / DSM 46488 / JCM 4925 / NBRC 14057 / NRRL 8057) TaxID=1003195 RepID=F8JJK6_STREN|nr:hypothetical protein [Streptantibioticus cattleyicolor]AEW98659.1 hypothetical protein SCATT_p04660 [Streptantibioticus cattleyicolor NRRL 8057 = DSM 46488]CCB72283.1 exported protein of unknown function [Streptantibioticus cattleyicolor NRRL 8057 = DSM 46488]